MTQTHSILNITKKEFKLLSLTILLAICGGLGLDIHLASLPNIMLALHTDKYCMQQSITLYILGGAFSMLVYGVDSAPNPLIDGAGY
jgi:hypothetical protein